MAEFALIKDIFSAGGDVAMVALLAIVWRFDRRLVRLETIIRGCDHNANCQPPMK